MPRGPFGFPRLTDIGPFVEENQTPEEVYKSITSRPHSYRNYNPQEFKFLLDNGFSKQKIREVLHFIEGGRFYPMLKKTFKFYIPLDPDERDEFIDRNPGLIQWVDVYARSEDLMPPSEQADIY